MIQNKEFYAIEAHSNQQSLYLPNLHILMKRKDDGVMAGHCLDFDIWAYSQQKDDKEAIKNIFTRISEMVIFQIMSLYKRNALDELYQNQVPLKEEDWTIFNKMNSKYKTDKLKDSLNDEDNEKEEPEAFIFDNLTESDIEKFKTILTHLQNSTPEEAGEIIDKVLTLISKAYQLKLVS